MKKIKTQNIGKSLILVLSVVLSGLIFSSCEDSLPADYQPKTIVEGYLLVDNPISCIRVMKSQPVLDSFDRFKSAITDAKVFIIEGSERMELVFNNDTANPAFALPDQNYKVKPGTKYSLEVRVVENGIEKLITGTTTTPERVEWVRRAKHFEQYPLDTAHVKPNDTCSWTDVKRPVYYLLSCRCLDTLEYGKYLDGGNPNEKNRRIYRPWEDDEQQSKHPELSQWAMISENSSPVVWTIFKFYGVHEVTIWVPEQNFLTWFIQYSWFADYNENTSSVKGGLGWFGSASCVRDTVFVLKNQP